MNSRPHGGGAHQRPHVPWHNRTSTVLGVSVAGLAAIVILVTSAYYVARQFNEPARAPLNYVGPLSSATSTSPTPTTTGTITSTRPPITSDIDPDLTTTGTDSSVASSRSPSSRPPRTRESENSSAQTTGRSPRAEVTQTRNPAE